MKELIVHDYSNEQLEKEWDISEFKIELIKLIIKSDYPELGMFESVIQLNKQCLNPPDTIYEKLTVVNELMEGHGIESIRVDEKLYYDSYYGNSIASYINLGDTYTLTIIYNHIELEWEVISWGDFFEAKEIELKAELYDGPY